MLGAGNRHKQTGASALRAGTLSDAAGARVHESSPHCRRTVHRALRHAAWASAARVTIPQRTPTQPAAPVERGPAQWGNFASSPRPDCARRRPRRSSCEGDGLRPRRLSLALRASPLSHRRLARESSCAEHREDSAPSASLKGLLKCF